jgi:hypothetical protein
MHSVPDQYAQLMPAHSTALVVTVQGLIPTLLNDNPANHTKTQTVQHRPLNSNSTCRNSTMHTSSLTTMPMILSADPHCALALQQKVPVLSEFACRFSKTMLSGCCQPDNTSTWFAGWVDASVYMGLSLGHTRCLRYM